MEQQQIFKQIFGREEDAPDNALFLKKTIDQYPYFGPAHFFALKNTDPASDQFKEAAAKTALFFPNPFFLQAQLKRFAASPQNTDGGNLSPDPNQNFPESEPTLHPEPVIAMPAAKAPGRQETLEGKQGIVSYPDSGREDMIFEPLYATDYFASQGIKLSEALAEGDKLGRQLKSFTAWLKTMKKIHPDKIGPADENTEVAVRTLAEKSNLEGDILTEAMAEAYIQQGKNLKAAEVYSKLSLNYPEKNAYFAAKIESLNK